MRIRKRQLLFSSSDSLSPLNLSDPHLMNKSPMVVQLGEGPKPCSSTPVLSREHASAGLSLDHYQPSDQTLPLIGKLNNGHDYPSGVEESGVHKQHNKLDPLEEKVREEEKESGEENKSNNISNGDILVVSQVLPSSSTFEQDGRWCEGEKAFPLKKRKGRFENIAMEGNDSKKVKAKTNTKMNKKKGSLGKDDEDEESERKVNIKKKVTKRGSAVMEGSRCSRVNGRGWRCCQQTLVGYSLCEHHLGKGRLRSMTSVRNRSNIGFSTTTTEPNNAVDSASSSNSDLEKKIIDENDDTLGNDDEKKPVVIAKKRMKLGMVKARSMSSLLGQTDNKVVVNENNK
ncbi:putative transcription factor interactor and regulator C3H-WRC/GRF family [Medicago truncatula]|uniref:Putative transcription factor interactor and regulator C3H-WRC/GRF family n=1 Tax=Medicago truncatula TaxID=3880 RepID=G7KVF0_MEDTR|nr:uncharacterized protein LOC11437939 isoform X1 [Medicago truncatula]AES81492.2 WRC protein [Medicago truncatula]RHN47976.1 putative transcription factor interactor and regulator C3H-WRC/GRF family [Medicago truncatula]